MAKVSIATLEKSAPCGPPEGFASSAATRAIFDRETDPIHVHLHRLAQGDTIRIGPRTCDCIAYVWHGSIEAGGRTLGAGSSLIVEHGGTLEIQAGEGEASVLTFSARRPPAEPRAGGHVHLLPTELVPRLADLGGGNGTSGGMHADASCPSCALWLHENAFPAVAENAWADAAKRGVHSHSEDEVIFVTAGQIRLGARLCGPGTALAVAADTMYSFTAGPDGLRFINFRAGLPSEIRFADGSVMDEVGYWKTRLPSPSYLSVG